MTAMHPALQLPEIVAEILGHLADDPKSRSSLLACVKVNRLWNDEGTSFLWSQDVPLSALAALYPASRLDNYSAKTRRLEFSEDDNRHHKVFMNTNFGRLNVLEVVASGDTNDQDLMHYLQPQLTYFEIRGVQISDAFLQHIVASTMLRPKIYSNLYFRSAAQNSAHRS